MAHTIYVIEHARPETLGVIALGLDSAGLEARYIRVFGGTPVPESMDDAAGLIVLGGPMSAYDQDRYPFLRAEQRLIKQALAQQKPILGICLGSQLLAAALGARVTQAPRKEIGWFPVTLSEQAASDFLLADVEPSFVPLHWNGDTFSLPDDAVPLASSSLTPQQAFRYRNNAYGFQFHMEVTEHIVEGMCEEGGDELAAAGVDRETMLEGIEEYLPRLESLAEMVFSRWASLVG